MSAHEVTKALGGSWHGRYGIAKCPCHDDRVPSLQVSDGDNGEVHVFCHAQCDWRDVKAALRQRGLLPEWAPTETGGAHRLLLKNGVPLSAGQTGAVTADRDDNTTFAVELWRSAQPAGAIARAYLTGRGIAINPPASIRQLVSLRHTPSGLDLPCLICAVQAPDRRVVAITRIFLSPDCTRKAPVSPSKMSLGPLAGNSVRLGPAQGEIGVAEGVETALSAMQLYGLPVWCSLGASNLPNMNLPGEVRRVVVFGDDGTPGREAAQKAGERFRSEGRKVWLVFPPKGTDDFNTLVQKARHAQHERF